MKSILPVLFILFATFSLQSCAPAFVAGAAAGGLVVYDQRGFKTIRSDHKIRHQIQQEINDDPDFDGSRILISSFDRVVVLLGQTPKASIRMKAERIAQTTKDVRCLYNEITINNPSSIMTHSSDSWITTKVKTKMIAKSALKSGQIKVITENGTVYLIGQVNQEQAALAVDLARRVAGVQKVVKIFGCTRFQKPSN